MSALRLYERIGESLKLLTRPGGALLKAERELIASTIKDLTFIAEEETERKALAKAAADLRSEGGVA